MGDPTRSGTARRLRHEHRRAWEEKFRGTLKTGLQILTGSSTPRATGTLPGTVAFLLHDTHGFPSSPGDRR
jgi:alanyl-tRNA synthetase